MYRIFLYAVVWSMMGTVICFVEHDGKSDLVYTAWLSIGLFNFHFIDT